MSDLHELLYADHDLARFLELAVTASENPFVELCVRAKQHQDTGELEVARQCLRQAIEIPELPSRALMVAWTSLRALGVAPPEDDAPLGVVIDVPVEDGLDTLAMYADGTARYFNLGEPAVYYEKDGGPLEGELRQVMAQTRFALGRLPPVERRGDRGQDEARVVGLFPSGTRVVDLPLGEVSRSLVGALFISATQFLDSLVTWALTQRK